MGVEESVEDCGTEAAGYACEEDWEGHLLDGGVVGLVRW